ncbi:MAG TPA: hypothetical protein VE338_02845, partial [Ktedonobacterales bacterium]|nr:hypothetical protein [Ktedonobacterales bacterium]
SQWARLPRLAPRELVALVPLAALIIALGVFPGPLSSLFSAALRSGPLAPLTTLAGQVTSQVAAMAVTLSHVLASGW